MRTFWFEFRGARYVIRQGETLVGRGDECTLQLDDTAVSRQHLMVRRTADLVTATDLGSSNGSFLNGEPLLGVRRIDPGDRITLGKSELVLGVRNSVESAIPPGIEILEQRRMPSQAEISTEPEFSTVAILESLLKGRGTAESPRDLAWMIRKSVDHLLDNCESRGIRIGAEHLARLRQVVAETTSWRVDDSFAEWAERVEQRLRART